MTPTTILRWPQWGRRGKCNLPTTRIHLHMIRTLAHTLPRSAITLLAVMHIILELIECLTVNSSHPPTLTINSPLHPHP